MAWTPGKVRAAADSVDPRLLTPEERFRVHQYGYAHWINLPMGPQWRSTATTWIATAVWMAGLLAASAILVAGAALEQTVLLLVGAVALTLWFLVGMPVYLWISIREGVTVRLRMLDDYLQWIGYPQRVARARAAQPGATVLRPPPLSSAQVPAPTPSADGPGRPTSASPPPPPPYVPR